MNNRYSKHTIYRNLGKLMVQVYCIMYIKILRTVCDAEIRMNQLLSNFSRGEFGT